MSSSLKITVPTSPAYNSYHPSPVIRRIRSPSFDLRAISNASSLPVSTPSGSCCNLSPSPISPPCGLRTPHTPVTPMTPRTPRTSKVKSSRNGPIAALASSVTPLTPNVETTIDFGVIPVNNTDHQSQTQSQSQSQTQTQTHTQHQDQNKQNIAEETDSNGLPLQCDEDNPAERFVLTLSGYTKTKHLASTLQGSVFEAQSESHGCQVVIKRTSKALHQQRITIQNGRKITIREDILREYSILSYLSSSPAGQRPKMFTRLLDFFESDSNFYLVTEHGGEDFFAFVVRGHQLLEQGKLPLREWRKFTKYLFFQMVVTVNWMHRAMHVTHLDISLENLTVVNGEFLPQPDGTYRINPNIMIKVIDWGLAEVFADGDFQCSKYCGKIKYKAPEVYRGKGEFDARKADIWCLGVVLWCLAVGSSLYSKPSDRVPVFKQYVKPGKFEQLLVIWKRNHLVTTNMINLLKGMLIVDPERRFSIKEVLEHSWLKAYVRIHQDALVLPTKDN